MALRALLFTSDGTSSAVLCEILTSLGIEAEICSELLVAMERTSKGGYDAILVDWDNEDEGVALLKVVREQKGTNQALNLVLVKDDRDIARALQQGANSAIKKPIDPQQAHDTLSTARSLICSRLAEQKDKEARVAAMQAASAAASEEHSQDVEPARKTGFVAQTAPRSALEAVQTVEKSTPQKASSWQAVRGPAVLREDQAEAEEASLLERRPRWDVPKPALPDPVVERPTDEPEHAQDSTGVFSSIPEEEETPDQTDPRSQPRHLVFSLVACLLVAGVLYVWAPGDSYKERFSSMIHSVLSVSRPKFAVIPPQSDGPVIAGEKPTPATLAKTDDVIPDPGPVDTTEVDPSKIQIIESKVIPKPGAQQPPSSELQAAPAGPVQSQPDPDIPPDAGGQGAQPASPEPPPSIQPAAAPAVQTPMLTPQAAAPVRADSPPVPDGRGSVVIPDSLKTAPSPAPASSLETATVSEEAARALIIHKVDPDYPAQALSQRLEGPVVLQVLVAKDGTIRDLKLVKGYFLLAKAASDAVKQWRFKPYAPNGAAIDFQTLVTVNFKCPG